MVAAGIVMAVRDDAAVAVKAASGEGATRVVIGVAPSVKSAASSNIGKPADS